MLSLINDMVTPICAFQRLREFSPVFLLESVDKTGSAGRFSYIGLETVTALEHTFAPGESPDLLAKLRAALAQVPNHREVTHRLPVGLVGVAPLDAVFELRGYPAPERGDGQAARASYVLPRFVLIFDHLKKTISIEQVDSAELDEGAARDIVAALRRAEDIPPTSGGCEIEEMDSLGEGLRGRIEWIKGAIRDGDAYQAVVSERICGSTEADPFQVYRALRALLPSPYLYYLNLSGRHVIGSSPETLVRLERDVVELHPLSGIRPCTGDAQQCGESGERLSNDGVEVSKHNVLVEQARCDCLKVCRLGTVQVSPFCRVDHSAHAVGLHSEVSGVMAEGLDQFDVFRAAFPAGTVTGAPKRKAVDLIMRHDGQPRGIYGGSVGYFSVNNTMEQAIAVRTIVIEDGRFATQAGALITRDTEPEGETRQIIDKCSTLLKAFDLGRELL